MKQSDINEFLEDNDFCGVFRTEIASWYDSKLELDLKVYVVTAKNNVEGVSCYEEDMCIAGSEYEVHCNGKVWRKNFSENVSKLVRALLEEYKEGDE